MSAQFFDFGYVGTDNDADGIAGQYDSYDLFFKANQQSRLKASEPSSSSTESLPSLPLAANDGFLRASQQQQQQFQMHMQQQAMGEMTTEPVNVEAVFHHHQNRKRMREPAQGEPPLVGTVPVFTEEERKERRRLQNRLAQRRSRARKRARLTGEVYDESAMVFEEEAELRRLDARLRAAESGEPLVEHAQGRQMAAAPTMTGAAPAAPLQPPARPASAPQTATPQAAYSRALASLAPPAKAVSGPVSSVPQAAATLLDESVVPSISPKTTASGPVDADVEALRNMASSPEMEIFRSRFRLFYVDLRTVSFFDDLAAVAKTASIGPADLFLLAAAAAACSRWLGSPAEAKDFARIARRFTDMQADERNCVANLLIAYVHVDAGETVAATQYAAIAKTSCNRQDMHASCDFVALACSPSNDRRNDALQSLAVSPLAEAVLTAKVAGSTPADAAVYASLVRTIPGIVGTWLAQRL